MSDVIENLLKDYVPKHSEFQIDNFIVGSQGDTWAQYKQALREIKSRYGMLIQLREDFELAALNGNGRRFLKFGKRARAKAVIEAARDKRRHKAMLENLEHTERELACFVELASDLKNVLGDIDADKRQRLEAQSWWRKALRMAGVDMLVNGRIGQATMELIVALPVTERDMVLGILSPAANPDPLKLIGM